MVPNMWSRRTSSRRSMACRFILPVLLAAARLALWTRGAYADLHAALPRLQLLRPVGGAMFGWQDDIEFQCTVHGHEDNGWTAVMLVDGMEVGSFEILQDTQEYSMLLL